MRHPSLPATLKGLLSVRAPQVTANHNAKPAGVLVLLYLRERAWHVLLNLRSDSVGEHKGEVAFPGGSLEPQDVDLRACALREAREEMGIQPSDVTILGSLDTVFTRTGYLVWPTVGTIPYPYQFNADAREVAEVIHVPLKSAMSPAAQRHETRLQKDGSVEHRISYVHGQHLIFGATALILEQLLGLVQQARDDNSATFAKEVQ